MSRRFASHCRFFSWRRNGSADIKCSCGIRSAPLALDRDVRKNISGLAPKCSVPKRCQRPASSKGLDFSKIISFGSCTQPFKYQPPMTTHSLASRIFPSMRMRVRKWASPAHFRTRMRILGKIRLARETRQHTGISPYR